MSADRSRQREAQVACSCGNVEQILRWTLVDENARPQLVKELAAQMPDTGTCSHCDAELPKTDFFAVLRSTPAGPVCFLFAEDPKMPGITHEELVGEEAVRTIRLPFAAAPVVLSRDLEADLGNAAGGQAEVEAMFGHQAAVSYGALLEEVGLIETERRCGELVNLLGEVETADAFEELVDSTPELLGDDVLEYLERVASLEAFRASLEVIAALLRDARNDLARAWERYTQDVSSEEPAGENLEAALQNLESLTEEERWEEVIATARPALAEVERLGYGIAAAIIHSQLGVALTRNGGGDRPTQIEEAIEHLRLASELAPDRGLRAKQLINLAGAVGQRLIGDPNENFEEALRLLERAADQLDRESEPREWSTLQTNLCRSLQVRESGQRVANLERALGHCQAALGVRLPETNAEDWAYSQINLGVTLQLLAGEGVGEIAEARGAFEQILAERERVGRRWMIAQALGALGELDRIEAHTAAEAGEPDRARELLVLARSRLRAALELIDPAGQRPIYGRLLNHLADTDERLGDDRAAARAWSESLELLSPESSPLECQEVGYRLGGLHSRAGNWEPAAAAYRQALAAADMSFHARLHSVGRLTEIRRQGNLSRWAAYAVARAGSPEEAVLILEAGRARELARRASGEGIDSADLDGLPDELASAYLNSTAALRSAALGDDSGGASRALQELLAEIRREPGFKNFAKAPTWEQIAAALEPGIPLIYLNPTPAGTVLLCVDREENGEVVVEPIFRDTPRGTDVAAAVLLGGDIDGGTGDHSYLGTASGMTPDRDLGISLETLLPWLGAEFGSPLAEHLARCGAGTATLVPCGLIGLTPIHAATWVEDGAPRTLIEDFEIRYATSAAIQAASLGRRARAAERPPHLIALGNPTGADLEAAEGEVEEIAANFSAQQTSVAIGPAATSEFLLHHAAEATHLHLACHASGAAFDVKESVIKLADRDVLATDLAAIGPLGARLTVASACQTAISDVADLPEEVISISSLLLAAGSACVIASLWSVDDYATALLMSRLYERLAEGDGPAAALRHAQIWLAELGPDDEDAYLSSHPQLRASFASRDRSRHPARWLNTSPSLGAASNRYSHPVFWAPFIAVGA